MTIAGRAAALEVRTSDADNPRDFQRLLGAPDVVFRYIPAGFRRNDAEPFIEHLRAGSVEHLRGTRGRHPAELLGTDGHEDIFPLDWPG